MSWLYTDTLAMPLESTQNQIFRKILINEAEINIHLFLSQPSETCQLRNVKSYAKLALNGKEYHFIFKVAFISKILAMKCLDLQNALQEGNQKILEQVIMYLFFQSIHSLSQQALKDTFRKKKIKSTNPSSSNLIHEKMRKWMYEFFCVAPEKRKYLKIILNEFGLDLIKLFDGFSKNEKKQFINTLLLIGWKLSKQKKAEVTYHPKIKGNEPTFSFLMLPEGQIYVTLKQIARGSSKKVSACVELNSLDFFARIVIKGGESVEAGLIELELLASLHLKASPYFAPPFFFSYLQNENKLIALQIKYDTNAFLFAYQNLNQFLDIIKFCAKALTEVHDRGFAFLDFKLLNVIIKQMSSQQLEIRLCDFGSMKKIGENAEPTTIAFMPPEALLGEFKSDIKWDSYSLGASILHFLFRQNSTINHLFIISLGLIPYNKLHTLLEPLKSKEKDIESQARNFLIDLALQLIVEDPIKRISCAQASEQLDNFQSSMEIE